MSEHDRIDDAEILWRRIHVTHLVDTGGGPRAASAAFKTTDLSIDRAGLVESAGGDIRVTAAGGAGVAELAALQYRTVALEPVPDPIPENPAHAIVRGVISRGQATALSRACVFRPI